MFSNVRLQVRTWREAVAQIQKLDAELWRNISIMTPYEQGMVSELLNRTRAEYRGMIEGGAIGEFNAAIQEYQSAQARLDRARTHEVNSWDSVRLKNEMELVEMRANQVLRGDNPAGELEALRQEAAQSGDKHKIRASLEVTRGALSKIPADHPDRMKVNRLAKEAGRELEELRTSDGIKAALVEGEARFKEMMKARRELNDVAQVLGDLHPGSQAEPYVGAIGRAWNRIHGDDAGNMVIDEER